MSEEQDSDNCDSYFFSSVNLVVSRPAKQNYNQMNTCLFTGVCQLKRKSRCFQLTDSDCEGHLELVVLWCPIQGSILIASLIVWHCHVELHKLCYSHQRNRNDSNISSLKGQFPELNEADIYKML